MITEVRPYRQYTVKLEGSGRLGLRNRRHLRAVKVTSLEAPLMPTPEVANRPRRKCRLPGWLAD